MAKRSTKLNEEQKAFVVQRLACFDTLSEIKDALNEEYGISISIQAIERYDPTKRAGQQLSEKYKILFENTRKAFKENIEDIPEANLAVRLRALSKMSRQARMRKNYPLAAQLLKQIAEEMGGAYTNERKHRHGGEKPGEPIHALLEQVTRTGLRPKDEGAE